MIALQSRGANIPDPTAQTAKFVNMMNMAKQQEAAQRQASLAQQQMANANADETRRAELHGPALKKAQLEYVGLVADQFSRDVAKLKEGDIAGAEALRANIVKEIPAWNDYIRPASEWTMEYRTQLMLKGKEIADKTIPDVVASKEYAAPNAFDAQGNPIPEGTVIDTRIGGFTGAARSTPLRDTSADTPAPRATPTAAPELAPSAGPVPVGEFGETRVAPDGGQLDEFQQDHLRRMKEGLGMTDTPASFTGGGMGAATATEMTPERAQQIVDSAVRTRVMAQTDFDQLMAMAPEQNKQPFMEMIRANNITLQPGGMGQQSQYADLRGPALQSQTAGLRGAPPMEQTMAQYIPVLRKNPDIGAYPGSARVPLSRVAAEAAAQQRTPAQIKAQKIAELQATEDFEETNKAPRLARKAEEVFATKRAEKDADFLEKYTDSTTKGRTTLNVINQMIGDARIEKGNLVIPKGGRRPHPGFEGVVGMGIPGVRFIPGTQAASFDALFRQAEGGAFLQAYESLRGTGQITEIEGTKATSALTRMERSQTEVEFVRAAREFADVIRSAISRSDKRYTALTGEAPAAAPAPRKTPTKGSDGWGKAKVVGN
jgi:hypothetical protein